MVKIRLKLQGKKGQKSYRVIVIESAKKRDGETIADLGYYNPNTNPSAINIDMEKYNAWVEKGAQPSTSIKAMVRNVTSAKKA